MNGIYLSKILLHHFIGINLNNYTPSLWKCFNPRNQNHPGGHLNGKKGYQARPWTHKKHPKHIFLGLKFASLNKYSSRIWHPKHWFFFFKNPKQVMMHPIHVRHVQCRIVKKDPFYVNFWTSLIHPLEIQVAPGQNHRVAFITHVNSVCVQMRHAIHAEHSR